MDTFQMLNKFYCLVDRVTANAGGRVLKFMGDGSLMVYPEGNAQQAVASLTLLKSEAQGIWSDFDKSCTVRTKAHIGSVVCGPMGPEKRFDAIGNTINELYRMSSDGPEISDALRTFLGR